jgi:23S rRNA U2552 (ribose-2'-O)-methylase RlmE/FtsJ
MPPKKNTEKKDNKITKQEKEIQIQKKDETKQEKEDETNEKDEEYLDIDINIFPLCFYIDLDSAKKNYIFEQSDKITVQTSENINYPQFEYGFHHFIHQSKNYLNDETKKFEGKKKVWNVLNRYEPIIDNYQQTMIEIVKKYFESNLNNKLEITNYSFYKLWELFMYYDLTDLKKENFISAHLLDNAGAFTQATTFYREMFAKKNNDNDKHYFIEYENNSINNVHIQEINKKFMDYYEKEKKLIYVKSEEQIKIKCDLVTADGGFDDMNENLQEQESPDLILHEILSAIKILKKGGTFIFKFFETFTDVSIKIFILLSNLFAKIQICKPHLSKLSSCEKYAICIDFKFNDKDKELKKCISVLENIIEQIRKHKNSNIVDIFIDYDVKNNRDIILSIINMNIIFSNYHFKILSKIVAFIRNQVYSGDEYHENRNQQIEGTKYWTDLYLPKSEDINKTRNKTQEIIENSLSYSKKKYKNLKKNLIKL